MYITKTFGYLLDFYSSDYAANALAYNDDYGGTRNFSISYEMEAGETVYIYIRGYSASVTGAYTVFVEQRGYEYENKTQNYLNSPASVIVFIVVFSS